VQIDQIVNLYPKMNAKQLANKFCVNPTTIADYLRKRGVRIRNGRLTEVQIDQIVKLYPKMGVVQLGKKFGVTHGAISRILRGRGVRMLDRSEVQGGLTRVQIDHCVKLYPKMSTALIGEKFGVSDGAICRYLRKRGVAMMPKGRRSKKGATE
jgi:hypothetical protein